MSTIKEAIILAGGLGTRLRSAVPDLPKCMAPVAGKPFLAHVINYFKEQGIERFVLSLGYKHEAIEAFMGDQYASLDTEFVIEEEPLGTGGAIQLAAKKITSPDAIVLNGDTIFKIELNLLSKLHHKSNASCTLCLKPMSDFDRYGVVELNKDLSVASFHEKKFYKEGNINGGVYALNIQKFLSNHLPEKFSFEKDFLEKEFVKGTLFGLIQDKYFIDIGIPEDFQRAQTELQS